MDTFVRLSSDADSIWLCAECLPNLVKYLPTTSTNVNIPDISNAAVERIQEICGQTNAVLSSCGQSISQHFTNLRLLELKMTEAIKTVKNLNASTSAPQKSQTVPSSAPVQLDRSANLDRLIITNLPTLHDGRLIEIIVKIA
jgi:hypothetical protein